MFIQIQPNNEDNPTNSENEDDKNGGKKKVSTQSYITSLICIHHYRKLDHLLRKLNKTSRSTNSKFSMLVMTDPASSSIALYFHPVSIYISHICTWMSGLLLLWGNFTQYCIHNLTILQGWKGSWCWWRASTLWENVQWDIQRQCWQCASLLSTC